MMLSVRARFGRSIGTGDGVWRVEVALLSGQPLKEGDKPG